MAWFLNRYRCERCDRTWSDEWSCMCDDECPYCEAGDMSPFKSEDMTEMVVPDGDEFVVVRSPDSAEDDPEYQEVRRFPTRTKAEEFLSSAE